MESGDDMKQSYCHRGGSIPLRGETLSESFRSIVRQFPQRLAVVSRPQNKRLTYAQLAAAVDRLASGLIGCGFSKGDRIGLWSTNNLEWLLLQCATAQIGVVLVNINSAYRPRELAYVMQKSELHAVVAIPSFRSSDYSAMLREVVPELESCSPDQILSRTFPQLRRVVIYDPAQPGKTKRLAPGFTLWQELLAAGEQIGERLLEQVSAELDRDDCINIQYTSGTTGFPKAVMLSHFNLLNNAWFAAQLMEFTEQDRLCVPVPFYHCFGMVLANLLCLSVGACVVIACEHFDPLEVLQAAEDERCTAIHGVPTMFIAELEHPQFKQFDLSRLRTGIMAGAPCPPVLMKQVMEQMHCQQILIGYGETEASPLTHLTRPDDDLQRRTETVGTNLPHQEVKIVDLDTGLTLPCGEVGEICFRGYHIMRGYYGDAEATAAAVDAQGWLHSGDLGSMDEDGYVQVTGRLKEMITRGGENIYPREIEDFLFSHPSIAEVAVFGVPDRLYGEEVTAWIKVHQGELLTAEEVRAFCQGHIAHFKIPRYIHFVDQFPMTVTGKVQKFRMREQAMVELGIEAVD